MDKLLEKALERKRKIKRLSDGIEENKKKAAALRKDLAKQRKEMKAELDRIADDKDIILQLAKEVPETSSARAHEATTGFFDILNLLFDGDEELKKQCDFLKNTGRVRDAMMASIDRTELPSKVIFNRYAFRTKITEFCKEKAKAIEKAKRLLNEAWESELKGEEPKE